MVTECVSKSEAFSAKHLDFLGPVFFCLLVCFSSARMDPQKLQEFPLVWVPKTETFGSQKLSHDDVRWRDRFLFVAK